MRADSRGAESAALLWYCKAPLSLQATVMASRREFFVAVGRAYRETNAGYFRSFEEGVCSGKLPIYEDCDS